MGLTAKESSGDQSEVAPPVPIPNTAVKRLSADDTGGATPCGKYAIARRLFYLRKKAVKPFLLSSGRGAIPRLFLFRFGGRHFKETKAFLQARPRYGFVL